MLTADMIAALRCPICAAGCFARAKVLVCANRHSFDVARQGYVHLGTGRRLPAGDTAAMVQAREAALSRYGPLAEKLARSVPTSARMIVDLGGGTGHYLERVLRAHPQAQGMVFDVSKPALKRAAKRAGAVLADTWDRLPLADASVDVLLNVFAPRNGPEMRRVLAPDGVLIIVTPLPNHLAELRAALGLLAVEESKPERLERVLSGFRQESEDRLEWTLELDREQASNLVAMGPNAFHGVTRAPAITTTAAVSVTMWKGRPLPNPRAHRDAGR